MQPDAYLLTEGAVSFSLCRGTCGLMAYMSALEHGQFPRSPNLLMLPGPNWSCWNLLPNRVMAEPIWVFSIVPKPDDNFPRYRYVCTFPTARVGLFFPSSEKLKWTRRGHLGFYMYGPRKFKVGISKHKEDGHLRTDLGVRLRDLPRRTFPPLSGTAWNLPIWTGLLRKRNR